MALYSITTSSSFLKTRPSESLTLYWRLGRGRVVFTNPKYHFAIIFDHVNIAWFASNLITFLQNLSQYTLSEKKKSGKSDKIFFRPKFSPTFFTPVQTFPRLFCLWPDGAIVNDELCDDFDEDETSTEVID